MKSSRFLNLLHLIHNQVPQRHVKLPMMPDEAGFTGVFDFYDWLHCFSFCPQISTDGHGLISVAICANLWILNFLQTGVRLPLVHGKVGFTGVFYFYDRLHFFSFIHRFSQMDTD